MKIKAVNNSTSDRNRYCGPAVISAVTGMVTGEAARLIRNVSGQRKVTGSYAHHVIRALKLCNVGYNSNKFFGYNTKQQPTLAQWLKSSKDIRTSGRVFLIVAGNHFQLVEGRRYVCGRTKDIVSVRSKLVKRRCRVEEVYELCQEGKIKIPDAARKPKKEYNALRPYIDKMKKKYGFKVEYERGTWWVFMPQYAEDHAWDIEHYLRDEHGCYSIGEVAARFEEMEEFMKLYFEED